MSPEFHSEIAGNSPEFHSEILGKLHPGVHPRFHSRVHSRFHSRSDCGVIVGAPKDAFWGSSKVSFKVSFRECRRVNCWKFGEPLRGSSRKYSGIIPEPFRGFQQFMRNHAGMSHTFLECHCGEFRGYFRNIVGNFLECAPELPKSSHNGAIFVIAGNSGDTSRILSGISWNVAIPGKYITFRGDSRSIVGSPGMVPTWFRDEFRMVPGLYCRKMGLNSRVARRGILGFIQGFIPGCIPG